MKLEFFVPGIPTAKARPSFVRSTGRTYTPAKTVAAENTIAWRAAAAMGDRPLYDVPVELRIIAQYLPPKSRTRAERSAPWAKFKGTRPDGDNLLKAVMDAGNGVIWTDDALIASHHVAKVFASQTGLLISVHPLSLASWPFMSGEVPQ